MVDGPDRHQPLPGVLQLPGFLYRKLSPRGRRRFRIFAVAVGLALIAAAIVLIPEIEESKEEHAAQERREAARNLVERRRRMTAEQRPHRGRSRATTAGAVETALAAAIQADAARRVAAGQERTPIKRAECKPLDPVRRGGRALLSFSCTAVTSDLPTNSGSGGGIVGYPYRALAYPAGGRFTFCKVAGRPGEGSYTREALVELPRVCG